jgi:hypothetical protein
MAQRPRVFVEGQISDVYDRVGRGEASFKLDDEAQTFYSLIGEVKKIAGLTVFAWCVMPSHHHLPVSTCLTPMPLAIPTLDLAAPP